MKYFDQVPQLQAEVQLILSLSFKLDIMLSELFNDCEKQLKNNNINLEFRTTLEEAKRAIRKVKCFTHPVDFAEVRKERQKVLPLSSFSMILACISFIEYNNHSIKPDPDLRVLGEVLIRIRNFN